MLSLVWKLGCNMHFMCYFVFKLKNQVQARVDRQKIQAGPPYLQPQKNKNATLHKADWDFVDALIDPRWPTTWFVPRLIGQIRVPGRLRRDGQPGVNHGAFSCGHIGADPISLASMPRITVCMQNVHEKKISVRRRETPSVWIGNGPINALARISVQLYR